METVGLVWRNDQLPGPSHAHAEYAYMPPANDPSVHAQSKYKRRLFARLVKSLLRGLQFAPVLHCHCHTGIGSSTIADYHINQLDPFHAAVGGLMGILQTVGSLCELRLNTQLSTPITTSETARK